MFTYLCGAMTWNGNATVGFNAGGTLFENHPLSGTANTNSIACTNYSHSAWTNLVYKLTPRGMYSILQIANWLIKMIYYSGQNGNQLAPLLLLL